MVGMADRVPTFPLRLRNPRLRLLLREVAEHEHISQNELIEEALEHELSLRGARIADDLAAAAKKLAEMSDSSYRLLIDDSIVAFVSGEAQPEPIQAYALHGKAGAGGTQGTTRALPDPLGVLAAFESGRL
jgi:hypothetical protein